MFFSYFNKISSAICAIMAVCIIWQAGVDYGKNHPEDNNE